MKRPWRILALSTIAAVAHAGPSPSIPAPFAAELWHLDAGGNGKQVGKVNAGNRKMRFEMEDQGMQLALIFDLSSEGMIMLMPQAKVAMELSGEMAREARSQPGAPKEQLADLIVAPDGNPCRGERAPKCKKAGSETREGRVTDRWEEPTEKGKAQHWVDRKLKVVVKALQPDGTGFELRSLKTGPQPDALFAIPPEYEVIPASQMPLRPPGASGP